MPPRDQYTLIRIRHINYVTYKAQGHCLDPAHSCLEPSAAYPSRTAAHRQPSTALLDVRRRADTPSSPIRMRHTTSTFRARLWRDREGRAAWGWPTTSQKIVDHIQRAHSRPASKSPSPSPSPLAMRSCGSGIPSLPTRAEPVRLPIKGERVPPRKPGARAPSAHCAAVAVSYVVRSGSFSHLLG